MLNVIMQSVVMLNVIMLSVVMLIVIMLGVVAPFISCKEVRKKLIVDRQLDTDRHQP